MTPLPYPLVIGSHNAGKITELLVLLGGHPAVKSARDLDVAAPDETGDTYRANAELKAVAVRDATGFATLADDTGLAADALGGAPGVQTARFAESAGGWPAALEALRGATLDAGASVAATMSCALALAPVAGPVRSVQADVRGTLRWPPRPQYPGFAAIFVPDEGALETDGVLLHRRLAFESLMRPYGR